MQDLLGNLERVAKLESVKTVHLFGSIRTLFTNHYKACN